MTKLLLSRFAPKIVPRVLGERLPLAPASLAAPSKAGGVRDYLSHQVGKACSSMEPTQKTEPLWGEWGTEPETSFKCLDLAAPKDSKPPGPAPHFKLI